MLAQSEAPNELLAFLNKLPEEAVAAMLILGLIFAFITTLVTILSTRELSQDDHAGTDVERTGRRTVSQGLHAAGNRTTRERHQPVEKNAAAVCLREKRS